MPYRMIAIDLDGTLLASRRQRAGAGQGGDSPGLDAGLAGLFCHGPQLDREQGDPRNGAHHSTAVFVSGAMVMDTKRRSPCTGR